MTRILLLALLVGPVRAQDDIQSGVDRLLKKSAKTTAADYRLPDVEKKRLMFDAACGADVDLDGAKSVGDNVAMQSQEFVGNCWANAGCYALDYKRLADAKKSGTPQSEVPPCDPLLTSVAVKLSDPGRSWDRFDKGKRAGTFVDSGYFGVFPDALKASKFGRLEGMCEKGGCFCTRATDQEIPDAVLMANFYAAKEVVEKHLKKVFERKLRFNPVWTPDDAVYDSPQKTALRIANELDTKNLPGIIRSALDDGTLARMVQMQKLGAAFDNKAFATTILQQSCNPVPMPPAMTVVSGPEGLSEAERKALITSPLSGAAKMKGLFTWINGSLAKDSPVMIGFCSELFGYTNALHPENGDYVAQPKAEVQGPVVKPASSVGPGSANGCGEHAVVITGRKMMGGHCYYGIRNSWGPVVSRGANYPNPELKFATKNSVWIPAYLLLQNTFNVGTYSK